MFLIAGIDALGAITGEEVLVKPQPGKFFQNRYAVFFRRSRVNGRLINYNIALLQNLSDALRGLYKRGEVGLLMFINRCRNRHNENIALLQVLKIESKAQFGRFFQLSRIYFKSRVNALPQFRDSPLIDIETDNGSFFTKFNSKRKTNIA
ncbi:hypothetical protein PA50071_09040 [Pseudomonas aeruginosa DSM 50071 = NBRC 12689]|nr:hypothetical protein PA50071_09040 [Pseudomonas aeruginosa DSM 50071 = NBRC 12689]KMN04974.1 hypothetical protein TU83_10745 [Pseudomonas aeruginosa]KPE40755.1 hypothetical protein AOA74_01570 [Pseudomonas aeruginosa]